MIVAYNSEPVIMGAFFDTIIKRNMAAVKRSIESVKKTVDKARTQATIKQEQQKKAKKIMLIAAVGVIGIMLLKKKGMSKSKKLSGYRKKSEEDYGREYAKFLDSDERVDINKMVTRSTDIPPEDYRQMINDGIDNPDSRKYWEGFNSAI